jgi:hypothetical protein
VRWEDALNTQRCELLIRRGDVISRYGVNTNSHDDPS